MKPFGPGPRRSAGARRAKVTRPPVNARPADAALGRATRGLVGPARRGSGAPRRGAGGGGARSIASGLRGFGRIVTPARAAGLMGMLATGFLFTLVTGPTAFGLRRTDLPALTWTDPATVRAVLALTDGTNVVRLDTAPLAAALRALPAVASASVAVGLPDGVVVVSIQERTPVLAWQVGNKRFLADRDGTVFAIADAGSALPAGVAVVDDRRVGAADSLAIGAKLDAVDADVATRLGSLTPTDVGSTATRLRLVVDDTDGFSISVSGGWTAVFGFYSPATRPTDMIPGQVRLLRSLLADREGAAARIILASETEGTYVPRATPKATPR